MPQDPKRAERCGSRGGVWRGCWRCGWRRCSCPAVRLTQRRIAPSEWTKLRSVRSSRWALAATLLFIVGIGVIACAVIAADWPHSSLHDRANFQALTATRAGVNLAQLSVGALGVLVITAEYSTGMIRSTFSVIPKRLPVLWGKAHGGALRQPTRGVHRVLRRAGDPLPQHINIAISHPGPNESHSPHPLRARILKINGDAGEALALPARGL
jgi:hypothetical protein